MANRLRIPVGQGLTDLLSRSRLCRCRGRFFYADFERRNYNGSAEVAAISAVFVMQVMQGR